MRPVGLCFCLRAQYSTGSITEASHGKRILKKIAGELLTVPERADSVPQVLGFLL